MGTSAASRHLQAALFLCLVSHALSHGGGEVAEMGGMNMSTAHSGGGHHMDMALSDADKAVFAMQSYWSLSDHMGLMNAHIGVMTLAWVFILPITVMLSIARSRRLIIPAHLAFLVANAVGIILSIFFDAQTPDLYEDNAHHKMGWAFTWIGCAWSVLSVFVTFTKSNERNYQPISSQAMAEHHQLTAETQQTSRFHDYRWSRDSGQGTERNTASLTSNSRSNSWTSADGHLPTRKHFHDHFEDDDVSFEHRRDSEEEQGFLRGTSAADRFVEGRLSKLALGSRVSTTVSLLQTLLERLMLVFGFVLLATGMVTYGGLGRAHHVFNILAHLIKGGIFFVYGFLTFGRWLGCYADFGWAWNAKPSADVVGKLKARVPSAEFVESFVIFLYGASNVFLEHLTAWGQEWSPMDLEHISITIMFFGGGLLGMLIESRAVRRLVNSALSAPTLPSARTAERWAEPKQTTAHPMNPMPALVIFLLGIMMSTHTQHTPVSASIHKQWGMLFSGFALSRVLTYVIMYLKPPTSYIASQPPTEILSSFCLVSGGVIFMASNSDTVHALEEYGLDAMFVFTVVMGLTSLLLAWTVVVVAVKNWAAKREQGVLSSEPGPAQTSLGGSPA